MMCLGGTADFAPCKIETRYDKRDNNNHLGANERFIQYLL